VPGASAVKLNDQLRMVAFSNGDAFPLTLTLSRRERGQPRLRRVTSRFLAPRPLWTMGNVEAKRGLRFSLSQRERAGVRENGGETIRALRVN
jgi:hypothetical protein